MSSRSLKTIGSSSILFKAIHRTGTHSTTPFQRSITTYNQYIHTTTMAPNVPEKQWAMVIEKTGGPVDYKQIPGMIRRPMY